MSLATCVMVQGTASGVGKSVLATALCRVLSEDRYRVAPFKAQNMSLNAAVTEDGGEIGRAQAEQAQAAGVQPTVAMNPILLKPEADTRSQLVVLGKVVGFATADYWRARSELWGVVADALGELRRSCEVVVIEGAGSPAELNLHDVDLANMRVAAEADANVILVGDIERGGVFAQLLGTLDLLPAAERARVRALVVNKFRGDMSLFEDGVRILRERTGLPVYVLPYIEDHAVPSEDGLAPERRPAAEDAPQIAVIAYPHISNNDDLEPLAAAGAWIRYVRRTSDLGRPDLIVLPGSKATMHDLYWLRERGLDDHIQAQARSGIPVIGLCGGFQMLGRELVDDLGIEGAVGSMPGLSLLPVATTFGREKRTALVTVSVQEPGFAAALRGLSFEAYEIHVGQTLRDLDAEPFAVVQANDSPVAELDGAVSANGLVLGTYAHGLFADRAIRNALLTTLAARRGTSFRPSELPRDPYARLSGWLRSSIDVADLLGNCGVTLRSAPRMTPLDARVPDPVGSGNEHHRRGLEPDPSRNRPGERAFE
jgi:adenosylcobyric acid synthase